jgi:hypothetical protein
VTSSSFVKRVASACLVLYEGARFLWVMRRATPDYWRWRLGTVYGTFYRLLGIAPAPGELDVLAYRSLHDLWGDVWRDVVKNPRRIVDYLLWQRDMRRRRL